MKKFKKFIAVVAICALAAQAAGAFIPEADEPVMVAKGYTKSDLEETPVII